MAWENTIDPDPIAKIHPILSASVSKPIVESMGLINAAVVKTAMVEDPCAIFKKDAIKNGINNPIPVEPSQRSKGKSWVVSLMTNPNMPPLAVIKRMPPAFCIALSIILFISGIPLLYNKKIEMKAPIPNAMGA